MLRLRPTRCAVRPAGNSEILRDVLHNPREDVVVRIGMGRKASFLANSCAIDKKSKAADRPLSCGLSRASNHVVEIAQ